MNIEDINDLLPEQNFTIKTMGCEDPQECYTVSKYRKLWSWVLLQALIDITSVTPYNNPFTEQARKVYRAQAIVWFRADSTEICLCRWICDLLGHDYDKVRRRAIIAYRTARPNKRREGGIDAGL